MISIEEVKLALRVTHNADDALLQRLIDSAEQECLRFLNRSELPTLPYEIPDCSTEEVVSSSDPITPDVINGIILIVQQDYDGAPETREASRSAATSLWWPYRAHIGI
jgi:hypothetical protein